MVEKSKLLIVGATGGTGKAIVEKAIARGNKVKVLVRDAARAKRLFAELEPAVTCIEGDALNPADVARAMTDDVYAVISSLGIFHGRAGHTELTQATKILMTAMSKAGARRFVCVSSLGVGDSAGQGNFMVRIIQKTSLRHTLPDKETQELAIQDSGLDYTIIRPSRLMNGNGPEHYLTWRGSRPDKKLIWQINRADVAAFALDCLSNDDSIQKAYNITGCPAP